MTAAVTPPDVWITGIRRTVDGPCDVQVSDRHGRSVWIRFRPWETPDDEVTLALARLRLDALERLHEASVSMRTAHQHGR